MEKSVKSLFSVYFDIVAKFIRLLVKNQQALYKVLDSYVNNGMKHKTSSHIRSKAFVSFVRFATETKGIVDPLKMVEAIFPFMAINVAIEKMRLGNIAGRCVIKIS